MFLEGRTNSILHSDLVNLDVFLLEPIMVLDLVVFQIDFLYIFFWYYTWLRDSED